MKGFCFVLACFMAFTTGLLGQEALTIDDVIDMVKAKLRSRTIVQKINMGSMQYPVSVDDIVRLKKAGASSRIVDAVLSAPVTGLRSHRRLRRHRPQLLRIHGLLQHPWPPQSR